LSSHKRTWLWLTPVLVVSATAVAVLVAAAAGVPSLAPLRLLPRYPWFALQAEAETIERCAPCHAPASLHTCETCHDDHGAVELAGVPFNSLLLLTGDLADPGYIAVNDILPSREGPATHVGLLDLLAAHGAADFESVSLFSTDGGLVTIERQYLTSEAMLMPHVDGVRFAAENLHVSTWLKGITRIVVVGKQTPLVIDGRPTSIGRLLLGPTAWVTVEQTEVMLKSETDGQVRRGKTAARLEGALVEGVIQPGFTALRVQGGAGQEQRLAAEEVRGAVLGLVRGEVTLILPGRARAQWVTGVTQVTAER
jgi:hypothetical protein